MELHGWHLHSNGIIEFIKVSCIVQATSFCYYFISIFNKLLPNTEVFLCLYALTGVKNLRTVSSFPTCAHKWTPLDFRASLAYFGKMHRQCVQFICSWDQLQEGIFLSYHYFYHCRLLAFFSFWIQCKIHWWSNSVTRSTAKCFSFSAHNDKIIAIMYICKYIFI